MGAEYRFVKPKKGLLVRDPNTFSIIPETGATVAWIGPEGRYWRRRVNCGDCYISTPIKKQEIPKPITKNNKEGQK